MDYSKSILDASELYEYKIIISPPQHIEDKLRKIKEKMYEIYKIQQAVSRSQLMLVHFFQYRHNEQKMMDKIKLAAIVLPQVKVEMQDYGSYPSHSLFVQVKSKQPLQHMVKYIRTEAQKWMKGHPDKTPHFILEPHFMLAQKLLPWQYEAAWLEYSHRHFTGRFIAEDILVLRRKTGERNFMILQRLKLENMPVDARQGLLF